MKNFWKTLDECFENIIFEIDNDESQKTMHLKFNYENGEMTVEDCVNKIKVTTKGDNALDAMTRGCKMIQSQLDGIKTPRHYNFKSGDRVKVKNPLATDVTGAHMKDFDIVDNYAYFHFHFQYGNYPCSKSGYTITMISENNNYAMIKNHSNQLFIVPVEELELA